MNNPSQTNRVEAALNLWHSREERFSKLLSFSLSSNKVLLKEKLYYYDHIATKYKDTQNLDERFALNVVRLERKLMERQLYPNLVARLLRRLIIVPVRERIVAKQDNRRTEENNQSLQQQVQRAGFISLSTKIEEQMKQEQQQFIVPVSYYVNDREKMEHRLSFIKDQSGLYRFEGYKASLYNENKPDDWHQQHFNMESEYRMNTTEAYNLLAGRSVQKEGVWMQFDFNDKDAQGNFRIKEFYNGYGYNLEKILQQLPLKELLNTADAEKLHNELKNGNRLAVSFIKDGNERRYYIEANPQFKSVNIYDEHSRKITLHTALGNKTAEAVKMTHKINERQEQNHTKRNGMRIG